MPDSKTDSKTDTIDKPPKGNFKLPEQRFFGRRKGNRLSTRQRGFMDDILPKISVRPKEYAPTAMDPKAQFDHDPSEIWFEIGFGRGEHMIWQADHNPNIGFIGCEPFLNGVAGLLKDIVDGDVDNIRIYGDDARHVMEVMPDGSVDKLFLLQPDPWPKKRHARRRFVNPFNLDEIARLLKPGAEFRISTDHPVYREWVSMMMASRDDFEWQAEGPDDWRIRPDDWPETRYVQKALEGVATYFIFKRV